MNVDTKTGIKILCQIAQVDCKHDFGANARSDYYQQDKGCGNIEYTADEQGLTKNLFDSGYFSDYQVYHEGPRPLPISIEIQSDNPINFLSRLESIPIVCDFAVGDFLKDLNANATTRSRVVWIKNTETEFDAATKTSIKLPFPVTPLQPTTMHYRKNASFIPYNVITNESMHFYLSRYSGAKMFTKDNKSFTIFNAENKLYLVDRDYCKKNGIINKIVTGPNKTIDFAINSIKGILNGTIQKQGNQYLKYITKRLGDQSQAISSLRTYEGRKCVFVTHDTVARDFAITIGVPYIVWTYSSSDVDRGYYLFVNKKTLTREEMARQEQVKQQLLLEKQQEEERQRTIRTKIEYIKNNTINNIREKLSTDITGEESVRNVLKEIISSVYFLDTYVVKLGEDVSGLNVTDVQLVEFPNTVQKFENLRLLWNENMNNLNWNIFGIKNAYLCVDELIKIYKVLKTVDSTLFELYRQFIDKMIRMVDSGESRSRASEIYKANAKRTLTGIKELGTIVGGQSRGSVDTTTDFFEIDENVHAFIYLITELVNMFRENIGRANFLVPEVESILDKIHHKEFIYEDAIPILSNEYYDFTLPFENNKFVESYMQAFIDYEKEIIVDEKRSNILLVVANTVLELYMKIKPNLKYWETTYSYFKEENLVTILGKRKSQEVVAPEGAEPTSVGKRRRTEESMPEKRPRTEEPRSEPQYTGEPVPKKRSPIAAPGGEPGGPSVRVQGGRNKYTRKRKLNVKIRRNKD